MTNRRDFIKVSGIGMGGLAISASALGVYKSLATSPPKGSELKVNTDRTPTICEICFWKCAGWVYKNDEGKIWKIVGNYEDQHSNGRFCPRGTGGPGQYYDEDRLKTPLIRTGERGEGIFREASWDEAFDTIAAKMKAIAVEHGPECTALLTHGSGGKYFGTLLKAFGSNNIAAPSYAQCRGPREVAYHMTFGEGVGSPERIDIRDTKCLVLIGAHLGENMHNGQVQEMADAIDKGAAIITVDPRFSIAASKSKYWLPIKPATDLALLLSWIHVLIYEEWYNKEYVEQYTYGFEQLKAHVKNMTPEWAYGITTLKPDLIRKSAKEMANAAPAVIVNPGRHVTWYGDDTQRSRAMAIINGLLGSWGSRGGFYNPETISIPDWPHPPYPTPSRTWRDAYPGKYNLAYETIASGICDATIPDVNRGCNFKGWIVNGTNLIKTIPDTSKILQAIQALDLLVVIDTMPMAITSWADVVLPECTYLERYDSIRNSPHRKPAIALRMPAADPLYNTKPAYWMAKELSIRLGLEDYFSWDSIEEMLDWQLKQVGSSLEEMQRIGVKTFERSYDDLYFDPGMETEFNTNTGKIELYSTELAAEGFDPLPVYTAHPEPPAGFYRLNYGRAPMHTFGRTANNALLKDLMEENTAWINPKVAGEWGIVNGQYIWLENQDGIRSSFPIRARITERTRWDSVYMVHGFGHTNKNLSRAFGRGASDSELITNVMVDPIMGGTGMRGNFVTFKFEPKKEEAAS